MFLYKHIRILLPLALWLNITSAFAEINVRINDINSQVRPTDSFAVSVQSDIALKQIEVTSFPAEFCDANLFPYQPQIISGFSHNQTKTFNYGQHKYAIGEHLCVFVEDVAGNQKVVKSASPIALSEPELVVYTAESDAIDSVFESTIEQGLHTHRLGFVYRDEHVGQVINFHLVGRASLGTDVVLTNYQGDIVASGTANDDGIWQIDSVEFPVSASSVVSGANYRIKSVLSSNQNIVLKDERFLIKGEKVVINILSAPEDPINSSDQGSGVVRWDLETGLDIEKRRILLIDTEQSCRQIAEPIAHQINLENGYSFNFFNKKQYYGYYACLQIEDSQGRIFNENIGWVREEPKPDIFITQDIDELAGISDTFSATFAGAESVTVKYLSDQGTQSRDVVLRNCESSVQGIPVSNSEFSVVISDVSLHDRYVCLTADNGSGGKRYWLSEFKVNLINGMAIVPNLQHRQPSTPLPTKLDIPANLQHATIANPGCRGVLLSPDIVMSAAHCQAPFFHPENGQWAHAGDKIYGFLSAGDEKEHQLYDNARREIRNYYIENREALGLTSEYLREAYESVAHLSKYHGSQYSVYFSPYFGRSTSAGLTFSDYVLRRLDDPVPNELAPESFPQPLVYRHPSSIHLTAGEFRSHGIHEQTPHSGWRGGDIHVLAIPGTNIVEYTLVDTAGGESGSALWTYDDDLKTYGVIGAVRGGGAWSSVWSHGRVTRQALAESRRKALDVRLSQYEGHSYGYRDLRRAVANADLSIIEDAISSGVDVNRNGQGQPDGWMLARAVDFAVQAYQKMQVRANDKHQQKFFARVEVIKALMKGGANPGLKVIKPTRYMNIAAGDSVLHYVVRENINEIMQALWLNTTDFSFESSHRLLTNDAGQTVMHVAIDNSASHVVSKLLLTDVGPDIFATNTEGVSALSDLLTQDELSIEHVAMIDWIGKAYLYEPVNMDNSGNINHSAWQNLYCYRVNYQGEEVSFNELALRRKNEITPNAFAAITRLGNLAGVDANQYCL